MRRFVKVERIRHTNITARLPKKCFLPARSMPANITLKEMCFIIIKKYIWIISHHKMRLILFLIQTQEARLASALETMLLREIGPQLKYPSVGGLGSDIIPTFAHFSRRLREPCQE